MSVCVWFKLSTGLQARDKLGDDFFSRSTRCVYTSPTGMKFVILLSWPSEIHPDSFGGSVALTNRKLSSSLNSSEHAWVVQSGFIFNYSFKCFPGSLPVTKERVNALRVASSVFHSLSQGSPIAAAEERCDHSAHWQCHQEDAPPDDGKHDGQHRSGSRGPPCPE